jgi:hypothetical protein
MLTRGQSWIEGGSGAATYCMSCRNPLLNALLTIHPGSPIGQTCGRSKGIQTDQNWQSSAHNAIGVCMPHPIALCSRACAYWNRLGLASDHRQIAARPRLMTPSTRSSSSISGPSMNRTRGMLRGLRPMVIRDTATDLMLGIRMIAGRSGMMILQYRCRLIEVDS